MVDEQRWVAFVARLNRMTQEGSLKWRMCNPPKDLISGTDSKIPAFFWTKLKDRNIALYLERYRSFDIEREEPYWSSRIVLAFCTPDLTPLWEFPPLAGISDLFDSVQRCVADVDSFIDEVLSEDSDNRS